MKSNHDIIAEFRKAVRRYKRAFRRVKELSEKKYNSREFLLAKYSMKPLADKCSDTFMRICDYGLDDRNLKVDTRAAYEGRWDSV